MMDITTDAVKTLFEALASRMTSERGRPRALDGAIGDADHGIAIEQGMAAASAAVAAPEPAILQEMFNAAAKTFLNAVLLSLGRFMRQRSCGQARWLAPGSRCRPRRTSC